MADKIRLRLVDLAAKFGCAMPSAAYWQFPSNPLYAGDYRHAIGNGGDVIRFKPTPAGFRWQSLR
jgi:hypothetical protein